MRLSKSTNIPARSKQRGVTLVELTLVIAVMLIMTVMSTKAIGYLILMKRAEPVSADIARILDRAVSAGIGNGNDVYTFLNNTYLQKSVSDSSVLAIVNPGPGGVVHHGLGAGLIGVSSDVVNFGTVAGSGVGNDYGFVLATLSGISDAVCVKLASSFGMYADRVVINSVKIKDSSPTATTTAWNMGTAQTACDAGGGGGANQNIITVGRRLVSIPTPINNVQPDSGQ